MQFDTHLSAFPDLVEELQQLKGDQNPIMHGRVPVFQ